MNAAAVRLLDEARLTPGGLRLAVMEPGPAHEAHAAAWTRPPVLFVPGLFAGAWVFEAWQRWFAARGWRTAALDLRGRPGSRAVAAMGRVSMADYAADTLDAARVLGEPAVIGHSMGGLLAQLAAAAGAVRAAVLVCSAPPAGIPVATPRLVLRQLRHIPALLGSRPLGSSLAEHAALTMNRLPPAERAAIHARLIADSGRASREMSLGRVRVDAGAVRCPLLSIVATDDRMIAPRVGRALGRRYGCPVWEYAGHGHMIVAEPGWERVAADVERWLRERTDADR